MGNNTARQKKPQTFVRFSTSQLKSLVLHLSLRLHSLYFSCLFPVSLCGGVCTQGLHAHYAVRPLREASFLLLPSGKFLFAAE